MLEEYKIQFIQTIVTIALLGIIRFITNHSINRVLKKFKFSFQRRRITIKLLNFFLLLSSFIAIVAIWGIEQEKLILFISSVLTILGIAFFAQWSILANITAGLILFFNHPLKLGDYIKILEKDFIVEGTIDDITFFFLHIKTQDGDKITIPNSAVLQKTISIKHENKIL